MKGKIKALDVSDLVYSYCSKILEFKVVEVQTLKTQEHVERFWILECQSCTDHDKCLVATKLDNYGKLVYSHMINHYDDEEECSELREEVWRNAQYYWHRDAVFFRTRTEVRTYVSEKNISYLESIVKGLEESILRNKKLIEEEWEKLNALKDQKQEIGKIKNGS